jgi:hypothetical protein
MRQQIRSLALAALAFAAITFTPAAHAAVPDWVRQAAGKPLGTLDPEINAVVLLDEVKYTIQGGDDILEHYRRVVKIVRKEGRKEGELSVWIDSKAVLSPTRGVLTVRARIRAQGQGFCRRPRTLTFFMTR